MNYFLENFEVERNWALFSLYIFEYDIIYLYFYNNIKWKILTYGSLLLIILQHKFLKSSISMSFVLIII